MKKIKRSCIIFMIVWISLIILPKQSFTESENTINLAYPHSGMGYMYDENNKIITITEDGDYIITGRTTSNSVKIVSGIVANITLQDVNIGSKVKSNIDFCAFDMNGATVNLTLEGDNILRSTADRGGLEACEGSNLIITKDSTGTLRAFSGGQNIVGNGAGIGGGKGRNGGNITIFGGMITAESGNGAGIGGGDNGSGGNITISGGNIEALSQYEAAIGGGYCGNGGNVNISGGSVEAISQNEAAIGGGYNGSGGDVTISGGNLKLSGFTNDIGSGINGKVGGSLKIYNTELTLNRSDADIILFGQGQAFIGGNNINPKYTLTYDGNNKTAGNVPFYIRSTKVISIPLDDNIGELERDNYVFNGWNTHPDGGGRSYKVGDKITLYGNITLYAKWTNDLNNNRKEDTRYSKYMKEEKIDNVEDKNVDLPSNNDISESAKRVGSTNKNNTSITANRENSVGTAKELNIDTVTKKVYEAYHNPAKDNIEFAVTDQVYQKYSKTILIDIAPKTYKISFDSSGGSPVGPISEIIEDTTITLPIPKKEGYNFDGWYSQGSIYTENTPITKDITLKAKWNKVLVVNINNNERHNTSIEHFKGNLLDLQETFQGHTEYIDDYTISTIP